MLPYTLDNHFSYGYGETPFDTNARSLQRPLWCSYSRAQREPLSFNQEVALTAGLLADSAASLHRKPVVLLSGGMDSEVVVQGCITAGIDFETITFRFKHGLNGHELKHVEEAVRKYGVKHSYFDIDIHAWLKTIEFEDLFYGSQATSINLLPHMLLMNHVWGSNGMPILGNGDVYLENENDSWNYVELEYILAWFRHAVRFGILGGIGFFQHTPELTLSMLREPRIQRLGQQNDEYANRLYDTSKFVKYGIYRKHWPEFTMRPKLGGHEMVKELYAKREKELMHCVEPWLQKFVVPYDDFRAGMELIGTAYQPDAIVVPLRMQDQARAEN